MFNDKELLIAIFSVFIGATISLFPIFLTKQRDYHQKIAGQWKLLSYESDLIIKTCEEHDKEITQDTAYSSKISISASPTDAMSATATDNVITVMGSVGAVAPGAEVVATTGDATIYDSATVVASDDGTFTTKLRGNCASPTKSVTVTITVLVSGTKMASIIKTAVCRGVPHVNEVEIKDAIAVAGTYKGSEKITVGGSNFKDAKKTCSNSKTFYFAYLPSYAWEVAIKDSDFLTSCPDSILKQLQEGYSSIATLNRLIDAYTHYYTTAHATATTKEHCLVLNENLKKYHVDILNLERNKLLPYFKNPLKEINNLELKEKEKANCWNNWINISWGASLIFVLYLITFIAKPTSLYIKNIFMNLLRKIIK